MLLLIMFYKNEVSYEVDVISYWWNVLYYNIWGCGRWIGWRRFR